jgi:hypothetical protein
MAAPFLTTFFFIQRIFFSVDPYLQPVPASLLENGAPRAKPIHQNRAYRSKSVSAETLRAIAKTLARKLCA